MYLQCVIHIQLGIQPIIQYEMSIYCMIHSRYIFSNWLRMTPNEKTAEQLMLTISHVNGNENVGLQCDSQH